VVAGEKAAPAADDGRHVAAQTVAGHGLHGAGKCRPHVGPVPLGGRLGGVVARPAAIGVDPGGGRGRVREPAHPGRPQKALQVATLGEALAHEALVGGVLQEAPHKVGHAGDELADGGVHLEAQALVPDRVLDGLSHAVQHLQLVAPVGDAAAAGVGDGVGQAPQVVAGEGGPHLAVVVVQQLHAALVGDVGLDLALEQRRLPPGGAGLDRLGVPIGALDQADGDGWEPVRHPESRPLDDAG
jgi:hypothetical protein